MLQKIKENLLELFFPSRCAFCDSLGSFLCPKCQAEIVETNAQTCPACNRVSFKGKYCARCRSKHQLTGVISFGYFKDEVLKEAIYVFKYEKIKAMADILSKYLIEKIKEEGVKFDIVFYVPISKKREAWRGFNQAEVLAKAVAEEFGKTVGKLIKTKETKPQVGLQKKAREKNLKDAFKLVEPKKISGKRVLIIDDVVTTGTTLNECARVLRQNGARTVWAVVLAKE